MNSNPKKEIPVLFENDSLFIINKPAGISVQGGAGISNCIIDILERQCAAKLFPVHRLDKETSGVLLIAKTSQAAAEYSKILQAKTIVKEYRAVCFYAPPKQRGSIRTPLRENGTEKTAVTDYRVLKKTENHSYLSLALHTGRKHQIRIHLASLGCPIILDDKYGDFKQNKALQKAFGIKKMQLSAYSLTLPLDGKSRQIIAPLPAHMTEALEKLELGGGTCNPVRDAL
ncbi:RluA family pseudouridine synthase [Treponema phagedenis]|uniref:Pseudouridine synthase n=1 Tax=Treponema phagedenis TaxID=162 RepID=A0A0B7GVM3_TREPH|nr:RluA family pseudouridine synthase [Treponema phagedenis]EFW36398.1 pseudouridine synthase, RluA family [Treponema phagedenis F0421]NVP22976.1 RluA family pseudouridine synthase [Treponema phagedenis]QEJ95098.1 RluA family pseudouridine synthase [Treponema phagedenis]QEJ98230.1 RluA family pseudouridine synthase [Treponema phagedenis]QEK01023.1 RluA family pseudouridine synthase [Treponema phagedenis]